ncbi:MAG: hypothetical protein K0S38_484 [Candidatus Paceibacter sp.]|jgi:hypothetical protein|nr:hypothetical protein [Candidatus Paceibacter sp.]
MKKFLAGAVVFLLPVVALAQSVETGVGKLPALVNTLTNAANSLIPFFLAIAVVVFIYGVIKYILATGAEDKAAARGYIIYGIIGIAVIISLFGLIRLLQSFFGLTGAETVKYPQF